MWPRGCLRKVLGEVWGTLVTKVIVWGPDVSGWGQVLTRQPSLNIENPLHDYLTLNSLIHKNQGFPGGTSDKESACQHRRLRFDPWVRKISWRMKWQPTPVFLPGESHGQRSLVGDGPWGCKELDMTEHAWI